MNKPAETVDALNAQLPELIKYPPQASLAEFVEWYNANKADNEQRLLSAGALLVRGLPIHDVSDFELVTNSISGSKFVSYIDGNSPRTKLSSSVYTSTEYDPKSFITQHNELSYTNHWPSKIFFCCIQPSVTGGETPIADCRIVYRKMPEDLVRKIEDKGIRYIRNLNNGKGFGPSWQDTFETTSRDVVEKYCKEGEIDFYWKEDGGIRLIQNSAGVLAHPITGEKVWFNQIDQFHPVHLQKEVYETLMELYEGKKEDLPMCVTFGDGSEITEAMVHIIQGVIEDELVAFPWQQGDLLLVDNVLVSHGRRPFEGPRKILVSMFA